jgi:hypothetical protein
MFRLEIAVVDWGGVLILAHASRGSIHITSNSLQPRRHEECLWR